MFVLTNFAFIVKNELYFFTFCFALILLPNIQFQITVQEMKRHSQLNSEWCATLSGQSANKVIVNTV